MESRHSRMQVDRLRGTLNAVEALRDDQIEPLIAALHSAQSQFRQEQEDFRASVQHLEGEALGRRFSEFQTRHLEKTHANMRSAASAVLDGAQMTKLDEMLSEDMKRHETNMTMQRLHYKLAPPSTPDN